MDMAPDGTMLVWVDVFGIYVGNTTIGTTWQQLASATALGSYIANPGYSGGGYEGRIAPSNTDVIYIIMGNGNISNMFVSMNQGASFTQCTGLTNFSANSNARANPPYSRKMVVHPTTWTKIGDYPNGWVDIAISCTGNMNAYGDWVVTYQGSRAKRYGLASGY